MMITPPSEEDLPRLCQLFNQTRAANASFSGKDYSLSEFMRAIDGEVILVARDQDGIAGFAAVWAPDNFLHHLYIAPAQQGRGLGRALLGRCTQDFGLPLSLKCVKANTRACRFYEHVGFQAVAEGDSPDGIYVLYRLGPCEAP